MARTPLARRLQETVSAIAEARQRDISVEQVVEERTTRRELLVRAGTVGAAAAAATSTGRLAKAAYVGRRASTRRATCSRRSSNPS